MNFLEKNLSMQTLSTTLSTESVNGTFNNTSMSALNFSTVEVDSCNDKKLNLYLLSEFSHNRFKKTNRRPSARIRVINTNFLDKNHLTRIFRDKTLDIEKLNFAKEAYEFNRLETTKSKSNRNVPATKTVLALATAKPSDHMKICMAELNEIRFMKNNNENDSPIGLCQITSVKSLSKAITDNNNRNRKSTHRKQFNKCEFIDRDERNNLFKRIAPTYFVE
jgi:hypothetical protein